MTLTLEQVRQTRFHLARRNGYEPVDVDSFVDKVEVTLAQLGQENDTLKQQVDALTGGGEGAPSGDAEVLQRQLNESHDEVERLRAELDGRTQELNGVHSELHSARESLAAGDQSGAVEKMQAELQQVKAELEQARSELSARDERIAGLEGDLSGAHGELQSAQAAASERSGKVENIVVTAAPDAAPAVTKLLQMATEQAERLVSEAEEEAQQITAAAGSKADATVEQASAEAHESLSAARSRAEEIETQARAAADALTAEAQARTEALHVEIDERRSELFSSLETERDDLRVKVDHLRSFEERYRQSLTTQLKAHLDSLSGDARPDDVPDVMNEPTTASATPRLDALLNDQD